MNLRPNITSVEVIKREARYWLGRRSVDDKRQIARWKGIVTRLKDKLVKMIKILLH